MKLNFINQQFRQPGIGGGAAPGLAGAGQAAGAAAGMAFPPLAIAQAGAGLVQGILGYVQAHKAQKQLERLQTPTYTPSKSILDYYSDALNRYKVSPTSTSLYKNQQNQILRNQAAALTALGDRRSALSGINRLVAASNDASLNADVAAENLRNQKFGQLGSAAKLETAERGKEFQYNQLAPYQKKYALLAAKAAGGNQLMNAGLGNIFGGASTGQQYGQINQIYGG